jgi:hypothetical protein
MAVFLETWTEPFAFDQALDDWIATRTSSLGGAGYHGELQGERTVVYTRRYTPGVAIFVGLITFPIGILFWLLWKAQMVFTVHFEPKGEETVVTAKGEAAGNVAQTLAAIAAEARAITDPQPLKGW